ncbi:glutathione S-transferase family protein [Alteromonas lipotrueiana]|uniref:glutathione S-transferase family protein n=1 Tax=Alteromonas lipotrueiana TaxID=2803815 RepID=UPI001C44DEF0|nr:glutathione S-transferase [Alteromonas lipotrueiana]
MLTVHHLNNSRSQRILWLLEELGIEYQLEKYQRDPQTSLAPKSLKAIHPLGRSPLLTTEHGTLAESGAIIEYLIQTHGQGSFVTPSEPRQYQEYLFWLHFAEGSLMPPLVATLVMNKAKEKSPRLLSPLVRKITDGIMDAYYRPNLEQSVRYVESYLGSNDWFSGEAPSGADIQMIFPLEALMARGAGNKCAAISAYVKRIHQRPAYQRALEKGGPYDYA